MKKLLSFLTIVLTIHCLSAQSGSEEFTASGDFTVPAGVTSISIAVVGGGGGGGGNGTGGGGGGGYSLGTFPVSPGDIIPVTIGAGGGSGAAGGTTSVGAFNQATGGGPGVTVPHPNIGGGGAGGIGSGGSTNYTGGEGGGGYWTYFGGGGGGAAGADGNGTNGGDTIPWNGNCLTPGGSGGPGGGVPGGDGGKGAGFTDVNCNVTDPAANGMSYGGGGGGGNGIGSAPGLGHDGYALIFWGPDPCPEPSALTATAIEQTTALLDWTENGTATSWNVEWGLSGFALGTGTLEAVAEKPYLLEGLAPDTSYDYYAQAECGGAGDSTWAGPFTFQTEEELGTAANGIPGFRYYPNPMTETLQLNARHNIERVVIYTLLGQKALDQKIGTAATQLNVSNLAAGNYILKVSSRGESGIYHLVKE